jgi:hypothetical protein
MFSIPFVSYIRNTVVKFLDLSVSAFVQRKMNEIYSGIFSAYEFCFRNFCFEQNQSKDLPHYLNIFYTNLMCLQTEWHLLHLVTLPLLRMSLTVELVGRSKTVQMWKQVTISSLKVPHPAFIYGDREWLRLNSCSAAGNLSENTIEFFLF